jgi:REase_AHJR-like
MTLIEKNKRERKLLAEIAAEYQQRGYSVKIEPSDEDLPIFLAGLRPDMIATRDDENLVVEVKSRRDVAQATDMAEIESALKERSGWRFELVIDGTESETQPILNLDQISRAIQEANHLKQEGYVVAAFLLLWAATEGLLRSIADREQVDLDSAASGYLTKRLYSVGLLARDQYLVLEDAVRLRNVAAHGFQASITIDAFLRLAAVSNQLLDELGIKAA